MNINETLTATTMSTPVIFMLTLVFLFIIVGAALAAALLGYIRSPKRAYAVFGSLVILIAAGIYVAHGVVSANQHETQQAQEHVLEAWAADYYGLDLVIELKQPFEAGDIITVPSSSNDEVYRITTDQFDDLVLFTEDSETHPDRSWEMSKQRGQ